MARTKSKAAATEQAAQDQPVIDVVATPVATPITTTEAVDAEVVLRPDPDAPAISASEPELSFKIDFSDKSQWFVSDDGGQSKSGTGDSALIGRPLDLTLQLSRAGWGDGYDQRLRLAFLLDDGTLAELNLNAVNTLKDGTPYVTSPVRSLLGGLLAISESEDDMAAFCRLARFRVRPGSGKGVFVEVDVAFADRWVAMASPARTNQIAKDPAGMHDQLTLIKHRFRGGGHMLSGSAIAGDIAGYDASIRLLEAGES